MSLDPGRTLADVLDLIDDRLAEIDAYTSETETEPPDPLDLPGSVTATADDRERAEALLADLRSAEARVIGLRRRIAGEIAGLRRPNRAPRFCAPRLLDTSL